MFYNIGASFGILFYFVFLIIIMCRFEKKFPLFFFQFFLKYKMPVLRKKKNGVWEFVASSEESPDSDAGFYADIPGPDNNFDDDNEWFVRRYPVQRTRRQRRQRRTRRHRAQVPANQDAQPFCFETICC